MRLDTITQKKTKIKRFNFNALDENLSTTKGVNDNKRLLRGYEEFRGGMKWRDYFLCLNYIHYKLCF